MKKAYFQYYETFETVVQKFKTSEERDAMRSKIINYGLFGIEPESLNDKEEMVWDVLKDLIDDQIHRRETNTSNGTRKGKKHTEEKTVEPPAKQNESTTEESDETEETKNEFIEESENKNRFSEKANKSEGESRFLTKSEIKNRFSKKSEEKSRSAEMNRNEMNRIELNRNGVERNEEAPDKPDAHTHAQHFQKPTVLDVLNYCKERNNNINAERFVNYYESKGWRVGSSPMKDWRAAVRAWEQKNETPHYTPSPQKTLPEDRLTF